MKVERTDSQIISKLEDLSPVYMKEEISSPFFPKDRRLS
jgi:hypothetical protein